LFRPRCIKLKAIKTKQQRADTEVREAVSEALHAAYKRGTKIDYLVRNESRF